MEVYEELLRLRKEGRSSALATIVQCSGSSPQKEGSKMLVRDDGSTIGTLGGGCIEAEVIQEAKMAMADGMPRSIPFNLTEAHGGLVCGGKLLVFIEPVIPGPRLIILGAGHVGKALATAARFSGFHVTVADDREEHANKENIPDAHELVVNDFISVFSRIPVDHGTFIVIATRGHNHDLDAVSAALKTPSPYIGLLGSKRKKSVLFRALKEQGFQDNAIQRIIIPVGLPIGSATPPEIAVSIMAQIIQHRRLNASSYISGASCSGSFAENGEDKATAAAFGQTVNCTLP
ncbi:MAG: XdhC family protein [Nitrospirae bacterium]|nr:XdhC family protein [Nitrospirota bacterium]